ncbi:hypothetical protein Dimus_035380 [Dionaea muscipula]
MQSELGKLFIGGISWETNEDRLREYFSTFGDVVEVVIMKDRAIGRALARYEADVRAGDRGFGMCYTYKLQLATKVPLLVCLWKGTLW